jgi:Ca2+-binding EF-hand superfamily protein
MAPRRKTLVSLAFDIFDKTGDGVISIEDLRDRFDTSKHPDVIGGRKTPDEVLNEFLSTFDVIEADGRVRFNLFTL